MHVLFVNSGLGGDFSAMDIAITGLATYVNERSTHRASIADLTFHRRAWRRYLDQRIERTRPDLVAMSCNTLYMRYVREVGEYLKSRQGPPILLGGHHASMHPEETFGLDICDYLCVGDGEDSLVELLDRLQAGRGLEGIAGIWAKRPAALRNPGGGFRASLDDLPVPDWDLWADLDQYFYHLGMLYIIGSRGCPYQCSYCDAWPIGRAMGGVYFRERDPVAYVREIAELARRHRNRDLRLAQLFDPLFTMSAPWVSAFCDEYRRLGIDNSLRFSVFARIDHLDEERLEILGRSGCALLRVGIEAGDPEIRERIYGKRITEPLIREVFRLARGHGVGFTAFYILGGPGETPATLRRTIRLAWELDAQRTAFFIFKPFTAEGIAQVERFGGWINEDRLLRADNITFDAVVESPRLSARKVEIYQALAYFLTFGRRWARMVLRLRHRYFLRLATYLARGLRAGLSLRYLVVYFHIYAYDNVDR